MVTRLDLDKCISDYLTKTIKYFSYNRLAANFGWLDITTWLHSLDFSFCKLRLLLTLNIKYDVTGIMLLIRRPHRMLTIRSRYATPSVKRRLQRTIQLRPRVQRSTTHGGGRAKPGHPPGPRRQLQVQSKIPYAGHGMSRRQNSVVPTVQWGVLVNTELYNEMLPCNIFLPSLGKDMAVLIGMWSDIT